MPIAALLTIALGAMTVPCRNTGVAATFEHVNVVESMTRQGDIRSTVVVELARIAPEVVEEDLDPSRPLREQIDLDSIDWLNLIIGLHEAFSVSIPEADYERLITLNDVVDYVRGKRAAGKPRPAGC